MEGLFSVLPRRSPVRAGLRHNAIQELRLDGNLEDVSASFSWNVFDDFLNDEDSPVAKLLWLSDGVFVVHYDRSEFRDLVPVARRFGFTCWMTICDVNVFVRRGMSPILVCSALIDWRCNAEAADEVSISNLKMRDDGAIALSVTTEALVRLLGSNNVNKVWFDLFAFDEGQSRALATAGTLGCLVLRSCAVPDQFWDALHLNRSPRALIILSYLATSVFDRSLFAAALRVNTSIKSLSYHIEEGAADQDEVIESFAHNRGIIDLTLDGSFNNDTWSLLSQALARNGTVTSLDLGSLASARYRWMSRESHTMRTQALGEIVEHNTSIQQIILPEWTRNNDLYQSLVVPRLELNQFRPDVRSVQEAPDGERGNTFLNACLRAGDNLSMVYMLLRENTDFMIESVNT